MSWSNPEGYRLETQPRSVVRSSVDEAVEAFGGVGADGEQPDVVDHDQARPEDGGEPFGDGVVDAVAPDHRSQVFDGEPGHGVAGVDGVMAEASQKWLLPVPEGPHTPGSHPG